MDSRKSHQSFSSSSSSRASAKQWRHEVFLSFRGEDTRKGFTDHLYMGLKEAGVETYIDNNIRRGKNITNELVKAIQSSMIAVIVFSERYADSRWCLEELVKIMECRRVLGQVVFQLFYHVDPTHVRNQTGSFAQAFQKYEDRIREGKEKKEQVQQWREALFEVGNLSGKNLSMTADGHEAKFIRKVINEITREMNIPYLNVANYKVGIDPRVRDVGNYLSVGGSDDVRMMGIWGMGGTGKTTVAKAVYNKYLPDFEGRSFLEKVREKKLEDVQKQLLSEILKSNKVVPVTSVAGGKSEIKKRLGSIKVLVIVDDIDHADQLDALAIKRHSFGPGSRIIITTRDEHLLKSLKVDKICSVQAMNEAESLELLSWHAFGNPCPRKRYFKLVKDVVHYCGGLPLALQVLGRFLGAQSTEVWESTLDTLKRIPRGEIHEKLRISYDGLTQDYEKEIFLDMSFFLVGMAKNFVVAILDGCWGFSTEAVISVLQDRCLVAFDEGDNLMMHNLIRDMGREIVRAKSPTNPGNRSRLWHQEDVTSVLRNKSGTDEIEGLSLGEPAECSFSTNAFRKMKRLRLLKLEYVKLTGPLKHLSKELRWLSWHGFPLDDIPVDFNQRKLVAIDLSYSSLVQVWKDSDVLLENLKFLNLSHSENLTQSPDFSKLLNLEELMLDGCERLSKVHHSIVLLKNLKHMSLADCYLTDGVIPEDLSRLSSLEALDLQSSDFNRLPTLSGLFKLKRLLLNDCTNLQEIPNLPTNLEILEAEDCTALERMPNFSRMSSIRELRVQDSIKLIEIPGLDNSLNSMREIHVEGCTNLTASFKESILQGWIASGFGGLFLPAGHDIPWWSRYDDDHHFVSFQVPPSICGNLKALTVCIVYSSDNNESGDGLQIRVINHTKRTDFTISAMYATVIASHVDCLWMGQISNNVLNLDGGDEVDVDAIFGSVGDDVHFRVNKLGLNLEMESLIKEYPLDCVSTQYTFPVVSESSEDEEYDDEDDDDY